MNKVSRLFEEEKKEAVKEANRKTAKRLLDVLPLEIISKTTGLSIEEIKEIEEEYKTQEGSENQ